MSKERINAWETLVAVAQHVERVGVGPRDGEAFSAFTIAESLDRLACLGKTLTRLYVMRINGEHEKCPRCEGTGKADRTCDGKKRCPAGCKDGHLSKEEIASFDARVKLTEKRVKDVCKKLHIHVELEDCGGWSIRLFSDKHPMTQRRLGGFG